MPNANKVIQAQEQIKQEAEELLELQGEKSIREIVQEVNRKVANKI